MGVSFLHTSHCLANGQVMISSIGDQHGQPKGKVKVKVRYTKYSVCGSSWLALIVFKCLDGLAPSYLTDDCVLVSSVAGRRPLRSVDTRTLYVPRTPTAIGARNFAVAGPRVWNSLSPEVRMLNCTVCTFAAKLKTFLLSAVSASENF